MDPSFSSSPPPGFQPQKTPTDGLGRLFQLAREDDLSAADAPPFSTSEAPSPSPPARKQGLEPSPVAARTRRGKERKKATIAAATAANIIGAMDSPDNYPAPTSSPSRHRNDAANEAPAPTQVTAADPSTSSPSRLGSLDDNRNSSLHPRQLFASVGSYIRRLFSSVGSNISNNNSKRSDSSSNNSHCNPQQPASADRANTPPTPAPQPDTPDQQEQEEEDVIDPIDSDKEETNNKSIGTRCNDAIETCNPERKRRQNDSSGGSDNKTPRRMLGNPNHCHSAASHSRQRKRHRSVIAKTLAAARAAKAETIELLDSDDETPNQSLQQQELPAEETIINLMDTDDEKENENQKEVIELLDTDDDDEERYGHQEIRLEKEEKAVLTQGILEGIHEHTMHLSSSAHPCWTCLGSNQTTTLEQQTSSLLSNTNEFVPSFAVSPTLHIQQQDTWSCGYRNYQMMLSSLLPRLSWERPQHAVFSKLPKRMPPTIYFLPTLESIQASLQEAWNAGHDPKGAQHYDHMLVNKTGRAAWIGAMEVANLMWYQGIDAVVLQGINCQASRNALLHCLLAYFCRIRKSCPHKQQDEDARCLVQGLLPIAQWLLELSPEQLWVTLTQGSLMGSPVDTVNMGVHPLLPVHLQCNQHSMMVVGIQVNFGSRKASLPSFELLVLDPLQTRQKLKTDLWSNLPNTSSLPESVRLAWTNISTQDLQVIFCTVRSMDDSERRECQINDGRSPPVPPPGRVLTAPSDAVEEHHETFGLVSF